MKYVASVRSPGDLCATAKICSSEQEAQQFIDKNCDDNDFCHIQACWTLEEAQDEYDYQTQTNAGN